MRLSPFALLPLLAGCAGNVADHIGPKSGIVASELTRYGFDLKEERCVAERLGVALTPLQLRRLARAAGTVKRGYFDPDRLTARDFDYVAASVGDAEISAALAAASKACGVNADPAADACCWNRMAPAD